MNFARLIPLALIVVTVTGCSVNPVTGKRQLNFYSEQDEIDLGTEADVQIIAQYGILDNPDVQAYVEGIGARMVPVSHRPNLPFHFRVLDDPVINAFALPGGFVYITRGILGYLNNEAALAGVVGHEIGHITAQHGVTRMSGQSVFGLGLAVGAAVAADIPFVGDIANSSAQLLFLKYSRDDESQSDELGVQYATALGYDTNFMGDFFHTLDRLNPENGGLPGWMSTHPDPGDRWVRVRELTTGQWQTVQGPFETGRDQYLDLIDGLIFGPDPREGFFAGNMFHHPDMRFRFPIPEGWQGQNTRAAVAAFEPEKKAVFILGVVEAENAQAAANEWVSNEGAESKGFARATAAGAPAWRTRVRIPTKDGVLFAISTFFERSGSVWVMHGYAAEADFPTFEAQLLASMDGFANETDAAVLGIQPVRIGIAPARGSVSFGEFARAHPIPDGAAIDGVAGLAILNGVEVGDQLQPGQRMKVLVRNTP